MILSSSAKREEVEHYVELLGAHDIPYTTSADVERTKPEPDLIVAALEKAGGGDAFLIGDSTWDCEAAGRAGVRTTGLLTGGFSEQELLDAGAERVFRDIETLLDGLDEVVGPRAHAHTGSKKRERPTSRRPPRCQRWEIWGRCLLATRTSGVARGLGWVSARCCNAGMNTATRRRATRWSNACCRSRAASPGATGGPASRSTTSCRSRPSGW